MFPISRTNRHSISVIQPAIGTKLWYATISNGSVVGRLYYIISTDQNNKVISMIAKQLSDEKLQQSPKRDEFGWRNCNHSYSEGTITCLPKIENVVVRPYGPNDQYKDWNMSNCKISGTIIETGGQSYNCMATEEYDQNFIWGSDFMSRHRSMYSNGSTYTITDTVSAPEGGTWYDRRGINVETFSVNPNEFIGRSIQNNRGIDLNVAWSLKNRLGTQTRTIKMTAWTYFIGSVSAKSADIDPIPSIPGPLIQDPETLVSDLMEKLPAAQANSYANVNDLRKIKAFIPPIMDIVKHKSVKSVADLYLWWKYTYSTTYGDIKSYIETFQRIQASYPKCKQQTVSVTYTQDGGTLRYNVLMDSFIEPIWNTYGFNINLGNVWDMIPYSFVLDWFVNIGSTLESIDNVGRLKNLKYSAVYRSFSRRRRLTTSSPYVIVDVTQCVYIRERLQSLPIDVVSLHLGNPSAHLLDGSSLIVSNKKR